MSTVPVRYVGPQLRGVTLDDVRVLPDQTTRVAPELAVRLLRQDIWEPAVPVDLEDLPDTVKGAKGWVGDDVDRARAVLVAEAAGDDARPSLVAHLEQLLDAADAAEAEAAAAEEDDDQGEPAAGEQPPTDPDAGDGEEA